MCKRFFALLSVFCLVLCLLPAAVLADGTLATVEFGSYDCKLTAYDTPVYTVNQSKEVYDTEGNRFTSWNQTATGASAENWNAKFEWKTGEAGPTLTLKGFKMDDFNNTTGKWKAGSDGQKTPGTAAAPAKAAGTYAISTPSGVPMTILITGEDSLVECKFGITYHGSTTITSEGAAKLVISGMSSGISSNGTAGAALTLKNANLDVSVQSYYNSAFSHIIQTYKADLTIDGGNVKVDTPSEKSIFGIVARESGNVIIKSGKVQATSSVGTSSINGTIHAGGGKVIIDGGDITVTPKAALGIYGKDGVEINGGNVFIQSNYYGINVGTKEESADILINGGKIEIASSNGAFYKRPILGSKMDGQAGNSKSSTAAYDADQYKDHYVLLADDGSAVLPPPPTVPEEFLNPTVPDSPDEPDSPTTPTSATKPASKPAGNKPAQNSGNAASGNNREVLAWVILGAAVVLGIVIVTAAVLYKPKK